MRPRKIIFLLTLMLFASACNPLRKTQRRSITDSTSLDQSEIRKAVTDVLHEWGTLSQTIVEFYPPSVVQPTGIPKPSVPDTAQVARAPQEPPAPAVRRIVRTEIATEAERLTRADSMAQNDIHTRRQSAMDEDVAEKPPPSVMAVKWIAVGLVSLFLLLLILKFKISRL